MSVEDGAGVVTAVPRKAGDRLVALSGAGHYLTVVLSTLLCRRVQSSSSWEWKEGNQ